MLLCASINELSTFRGISHIRLIDFDRVTMSSLNRHATATLGDVGISKVHAMRTALLKMSLKVEVDAREELWSMQDAAKLLEGADWVIGGLSCSLIPL